uniref:Uncharacterized protein n=1 Tax=Pyramimonas obovata TaxID=1411642 RepID=A0A7S0MRB7_9CHLO|mmetsp:Transcript_11361/g.23729  ORF Transcript_11361/g.23729 Transcript_11361/m.23729 type:complete len:210 (+) Transcript_11361:62-691(+)
MYRPLRGAAAPQEAARKEQRIWMPPSEVEDLLDALRNSTAALPPACRAFQGYAIGYLRLSTQDDASARVRVDQGPAEPPATSRQAATPPTDDNGASAAPLPSSTGDGSPAPPSSSSAGESGGALSGPATRTTPEGTPPPPPLPPAPPPPPPPQEGDELPPPPSMAPARRARAGGRAVGRRRQRFPFGTLCVDASCNDCGPDDAAPARRR